MQIWWNWKRGFFFKFSCNVFRINWWFLADLFLFLCICFKWQMDCFVYMIINHLLNEEVNEFTKVFNIHVPNLKGYVKCPLEQIWLQKKDKDLLCKSRINVPGYRRSSLPRNLRSHERIYKIIIFLYAF